MEIMGFRLGTFMIMSLVRESEASKLTHHYLLDALPDHLAMFINKRF